MGIKYLVKVDKDRRKESDSSFGLAKSDNSICYNRPMYSANPVHTSFYLSSYIQVESNCLSGDTEGFGICSTYIH